LIFIEPIGAISIGIFYGFLSVIFFQFTKSKLSNWSELREKFDLQVSKTIFEGLGGIKDLLILGKIHIYIEQFSRNNNLRQRLNAKMGTLSQIPRFYLELVSIFGLLSFICILIYQGKDPKTLITVLGVFVAAIFKMIPSVNKIITVSQLLKFHYPSVEIIHNELKDFKDTRESKISPRNFKFQKNIQFSNIDFGFNIKNKILKGVNINIKKGQTIGIIGESGSGKSTFVDLLVGLHKPVFGKILIDGIEGLQMTQTWRNKIGYVSQAIYLTDDSILNNIALGVPEDMIDRSLINKILTQVQLEKFVNSLENGIKTRVGERGVQLSGGQKQRIGLARALYNKPQVLILDEATSALDNLTEKAVMDSVKNLKGDITKIIIAHRLSTLDDCNIIYELLNKQLKKIDI
jgi:ABC-type multidrug transport system fused ATPase/permease subunit